MVDQGVKSRQVKSTTNVKRGLVLGRFSLHPPTQKRLPATARLWLGLALAAWATAASGQEAGQNASVVGPLQYRTIFAPAEKEDQWRPTGKPAYFPMEPAEFHEKVALANSLASRPAHAGGAVIASARYEARLEGSELVDGHALLQVRQLSPQGASLSFAPCNLSILRSAWADRDGETARIGLGANRQLQLRVDHDGVLELDWTLRGRVGILGRSSSSWDCRPLPPPSLRSPSPRTRSRLPRRVSFFARGPSKTECVSGRWTWVDRAASS